MRGREFSRICLIKPSSLGDIIHALPVLSQLRRRYPHAHIAWLVNRSFAPLVAGHPDLDEVIEFDRARYVHLWRRPRGVVEFFRFLKELRARRFDLTIDLQGLFRSGIFARATRAPVRIGFREAREAAGLAYTHRVARGQRDTHAIERNLAVGALLGFSHEPAAIDLGVTPAERAQARALLDHAGVAAADPFVLVFPGARWETKRWPAEKFAAAVERIARDAQLPVVLHGGPDEQELCARIADLAGSSPVVLAGRTDLRGLVALIAEAAFVLCQDSGPMHMAAALGRPMLALVGPTNPQRTGPYRRPETVLRRDLPCSPCYFRRLSRCPYAHECMRGLAADDVAERVLRALERTAAPADT